MADELTKKFSDGKVSADDLRSALTEYVWQSRKGGTRYNNGSQYSELFQEYIDGSNYFKYNLNPEDARFAEDAEAGNKAVYEALDAFLWDRKPGSPRSGTSNAVMPGATQAEYKASLATRWRDMTFDWDAEMTDSIVDYFRRADPEAVPDEEFWKVVKGVAKRKAYQTKQGSRKWTQKDDWLQAYEGMEMPVMKARPELGPDAKNFWQKGVTGFFNWSNRVEKGTTYGPAFRFGYWEEVARYVKFTDPETAQKIVDLPSSPWAVSCSKVRAKARGRGTL